MPTSVVFLSGCTPPSIVLSTTSHISGEVIVPVATTENVAAHRTVETKVQCFGVVVRGRSLGGLNNREGGKVCTKCGSALGWGCPDYGFCRFTVGKALVAAATYCGDARTGRWYPGVLCSSGRRRPMGDRLRDRLVLRIRGRLGREGNSEDMRTVGVPMQKGENRKTTGAVNLVERSKR